jgi:hypothetical protein
MVLQILDNLLASNLEQWPDDFATLYGHANQTERAAASQQPEQNRLHLIIRVVPQSYPLQVPLFGNTLEHLISQIPGGFLKTSLVGYGKGRNINCHTHKVDLQLVTQFPAKPFFLSRCAGTKTVIDIYGGELNGRPIFQMSQQMEQGHRVSPPGQADQDAVSVVQQLVIDNRPPHALTGIHAYKIRLSLHKRIEKSRQ